MIGFETRGICIVSYSNNEAPRSFRRRNGPEKRCLTLYQLIGLFGSAWARSLRGDSITDGWSKPDFVLEIFFQTSEPIIELHGEIDSIQTSLKQFHTIQQ
jgi:hypothetical protein